MMGVSVLFATATMLPAYFISVTKKDFTTTKLTLQEQEPVSTSDQETLGASKELDRQLGLIEKTKTSSYFVSQKVINEIMLAKTPSIKITEIFYQNDPQKGKTVIINGTAPSREILLSFRTALEDNVAFKKVDLPISNFVKGSDIKFSLSLTPV